MEIIIDLSQSDFDSKGNLVSLIHIKVDGIIFPDSSWTDFIVIILDWWIQEFLNQLSGKKNGKYGFMDGPFFFKISMKDKDNLLLTGFEETLSSPKEVFHANVSIQEFYLSLKTICNQVLRVCHKNGYSTPDVKKLEKSLKQIQDKKLT